MSASRGRVLGWLVGTIGVAAVIGGLFLIGSPAEERARRLDARRVEHLSSIRAAVDLYWTQHTRLPVSLEELHADQPWLRDLLTDPSTGERYEYRSLDAGRYQLCARFDRESTSDRGRPDDGIWVHVAGRHCFTREVRQSR